MRIRLRRTALLAGFGVVLAVAGLTAALPAAAATSHNPVGHLDEARFDAKYGVLVVRGWAADPDVPTAQLRVHIYVDGAPFVSVGTDVPRPDVTRAFPQFGPDTGFSTFRDVKGRGDRQVCAYAINQGPGSTVRLGCRTVAVTAPGALVGHIDQLRVDPADPTKIDVRGWVLDPYDALSPTPFALIRTAVAGQPQPGSLDYFAGLSAALPRPDVDRVFPRNGHDHGFDVTLDNAGSAIDGSGPWAPGDTVCIALDRSSMDPFFVFATRYCAVVTG
jgi:hypothetical protein